MIAHSKKCTQKYPIEVKAFKTREIHFCPECCEYETIWVECEHEFIKVAFVTSNDALQIKDFCKKCHTIVGNPYPHSQFNTNELPKRTFADYWEFREIRDVDEEREIYAFKNNLNANKELFYKSDYHEYLSSDVWNNRRKNILERDDNTCQICGKMAECVHHLTYVNVQHEYNFELVSLCNECHKIYHPNKNTNNA